ncbi:MAG: hydrogen peroxide-inducible genes activator [Pseudomonadota bacterium]
MDGASISLKQMQYLLAVEETKHFRRAAERCAITQPSLSVQIQNLEEALGVQLVERSRSGVALTPVGREVVVKARSILDDVQGLMDFTSEAKDGLVGTIRLGAKPTLGPYLLPHAVKRLHRQYPDLKLYIRESASRYLERELIEGKHDVILAQLPVHSSELVTDHLFREPLYLVVAADHELARADAVTPEMLTGLDVLSLTPQFHLYDQVNDLCTEFGLTMLRGYEGTSLDALRLMVGMGMGVAFLPALYVSSEISARSEVVAKPLKGRAISRSIGIVWRKSAGRAAAYRQIGAVVREVVGKRFSDLAGE